MSLQRDIDRPATWAQAAVGSVVFVVLLWVIETVDAVSVSEYATSSVGHSSRRMRFSSSSPIGAPATRPSRIVDRFRLSRSGCRSSVTKTVGTP